MARNGISATGQFFAPVMTIDDDYYDYYTVTNYTIILLQIAPPQ